ncbi:MAG: hypothetical protein Ta2G_04670 [Termitinemataceae bacterium]|nr:MAG: hypothetical protein Ta2G_04670 [Termitinemataceae bacterium]
MGIFNRLASVLKSVLEEDDIIAGAYQRQERDTYRDPDLNAAYDELNDYLKNGKSTDKKWESAFMGRGTYHAKNTQPPKQNVPPQLIADYQELSVQPGGDAAAVKSAHKKLMMVYHPDKNAGDEAKMKIATEKTARINAAYERIRKWQETGKILFILILPMMFAYCKTMPDANSLSEGGMFPPEFNSLSPQIRNYLTDIHDAFKAHDESFLFSQGEPYYEKEMRKKVSSIEQYFALLYRIGQYSRDSTWELPPYKFKVEDVKRIKFIDYVEQGPVLTVNIMIILNKSTEQIPARIAIMTRLKNLKIVGTYP